MNSLENRRILLGISGGIAAYKTPELVRLLVKQGADVRTVLTEGGSKFVAALTLETVSGSRVHSKLFLPGDNCEPIHINLAQWADAVIVAPATANIIAKAAHGLADDLLSTILLASDSPLLFCPSMNPAMYKSLATIDNLKILQSRGVKILEPEVGPLASGSEGEGIGRLPAPEKIVEWLADQLSDRVRDLGSCRVMITAGPTLEEIDPIRYISNRSSGKMGYALAVEASVRGANVSLIHGPVSLPDPPGVKCIGVETTDEMFEAVKNLYTETDIVIMAAAVADFQPRRRSETKIKKREEYSLELVQTPDILKWLGETRQKQYLVGFALEDRESVNNARTKFIDKKLDLIVLNTPDALNADESQITLIGSDFTEKLPLLPKWVTARRIFDRVVSNLS